MRYKRQETFRYEFDSPLVSTFKIVKINGEDVKSNLGACKILDISPTGLKIAIPLNLQIKDHDFEVEIYYSLVTDHELRGKIVWQSISNEYLYGIDLFINEEESKKIVTELKTFSQRENIHVQ